MSHDPEAREAGGLRPVVIRPDVLDFALGLALETD